MATRKKVGSGTSTSAKKAAPPVTRSAQALEERYQTLLELRSRMSSQIRALCATSLKSNKQPGEENADVGSDDFMRETELALMSEEGRRLVLIQAALESIDDGTYGVCIDCGCPIGEGRLDAIPFARLCIDCKTAREENGGLPPDEDEVPVAKATAGGLVE